MHACCEFTGVILKIYSKANYTCSLKKENIYLGEMYENFAKS